MSPRRAPSLPPEIPGFTALRLLGSGGFADVFLYEQQMPRRQVAVKVMLRDVVSEGARRRFDAEANLMAQLSSHPYIVTVFQADVSADGRPFLVMEHCPLPNLGVRYKREPFGVAEALRVGIQVAGAVETVHRAGILHRDIKPANILVTEYRRPALTDFGISVATGEDQSEAQGMSIPWSPPEAFADDAMAGAASDVYSLAATVYTLLAGRSPFEVPGGSNGGMDLAARIESSPVPRLGRSDVPTSLERVLVTAMAKSPANRYPSALAFARALQQVQTELSMSLTQIEVVDDSLPPDEEEADDDGRTRIRSVVAVDPEGPAAVRPVPPGPSVPVVPPAGAPASTTGGAEPEDRTVVRSGTTSVRSAVATAPAVPQPAPLADTVHRTPATTSVEQVPTSDVPAPSSRRRGAAVVGALTVVVGAAVVVALLTGEGEEQTLAGPTPSAPARPVDVVRTSVPQPADLAGEVGDGVVVFTWTNPDPQDGDRYLWRVPERGVDVTFASTAETTVTVPVGDVGETCLEVLLRRSDGTASTEAAVECVTGPTP